MGLLSLLGKQRVTFIQAQTSQSGEKTIFTIDCTVSETHSRESPATEFEIENGDTITDHITVKPYALELQGIISDTPLDQLALEAITTAASAILPAAGIVAAGAGFALSSALSKSKRPSVAAFAQLLQLQATRQPFDVVTSLSRFPTMWIKSLSIPRDASTSQTLQFHLQLVQLLIVTPQTVNIQKFSTPAVAASKAEAGLQQLNNKVVNSYQSGVGAAFFKRP